MSKFVYPYHEIQKRLDHAKGKIHPEVHAILTRFHAFWQETHGGPLELPEPETLEEQFPPKSTSEAGGSPAASSGEGRGG